jgi:uncharacterized protein (DUF488 family)
MRVTPVVHTIGHGRRPALELIACLREVEVETLVDVRRFPSSRRNPQFDQTSLAETLAEAGVSYRHAVELGGKRSRERGEERFACLGAFAGYAARMVTPEWQEALEEVVAQSAPCMMCAETPWLRCHRRFISELLVARGHEVVHLIRPGEREPHRSHPAAEVRDGTLHLCGEPIP